MIVVPIGLSDDLQTFIEMNDLPDGDTFATTSLKKLDFAYAASLCVLLSPRMSVDGFLK
jgi:hypothetical protein